MNCVEKPPTEKLDMESSGCHPKFSTHIFQDTLLDVLVGFYVLKMKESIFFWIGDKGRFENLAVAISTPFQNSPLFTSIMGLSADNPSCSLASRLSKKIGKQVFCSYNLPDKDGRLVISVTERLLKEYAAHPEYF